MRKKKVQQRRAFPFPPHRNANEWHPVCAWPARWPWPARNTCLLTRRERRRPAQVAVDKPGEPSFPFDGSLHVAIQKLHQRMARIQQFRLHVAQILPVGHKLLAIGRGPEHDQHPGHADFTGSRRAGAIDPLGHQLAGTIGQAPHDGMNFHPESRFSFSLSWPKAHAEENTTRPSPTETFPSSSTLSHTNSQKSNPAKAGIKEQKKRLFALPLFKRIVTFSRDVTKSKKHVTQICKKVTSRKKLEM